MAAAAVTWLVVLPIGSKLPGSTDVTVHYSGTGTLLNQAALKSGDTAHAFETNVPVTIDRHIYVKSTTSADAIVADDSTLKGPGGLTLPDDHVYSLSRTDLIGVNSTDSTQVEPNLGGLAVAWPIGPKADHRYRLYDTATRQVVPASYDGTSSAGGRSTYKYSYTASGALKDPTLLTDLPATLPKTVLASLAPLLPAAVVAQVGPVLPTLPSSVPLSYTATTTVTAGTDRQTGLIINATENQQIIADLTVAGKTVPLLPVLSINVALTGPSINYVANQVSGGTPRHQYISVPQMPSTTPDGRP